MIKLILVPQDFYPWKEWTRLTWDGYPAAISETDTRISD